MKTIVFHLSDMHITKEISDCVFTKFVEAFNFSKYCDAFFVFSGDIAFSGKESQYIYFYAFLEKLKKIVEESGCRFNYLSVPGNHDLDYDLLKNGSTENCVGSYLNASKNYFDALEYQNNNLFVDSRLVDRKKFVFNNSFSISFALINTAPFSDLDGNDKGKHILPKSDLSQILNDDCTLQFTVMHHSKEWFDYESGMNIGRLLDSYTDILLVGHEHDPEALEENSEHKDNLLVNRGGLFDQSDIEKMSFYAFEVDLEEKTFSESLYKMNVENKKMFFKCEYSKNHSIRINRCNLPKISQSAMEDNKCILSCEGTKENIDDIFEFPRLTSSDVEIINISEFLALLENEKIIQISGSEQMGKSILLKKLFYKINDIGDEYCVLIDGHDIPKKYKFENFIKDSISSQLDSKYIVQNFNKCDISKRTLLIDDFDFCIEDKNQFISEAMKTFGKIVFTSSYIFEKFRYTIENHDKIIELKISFYTKMQRDSIIRKICKLKKLNDDDTQNVISSIDSMATYSSLQELCNPFYISMLTRTIIRKDSIHEIEGKTTFSETFKLSVGKMLEKNGKSFSVEDKILILSMLSYNLFTEKKYEFSYEDLNKIKQPLEDKHDIHLNIMEFINDMKEIGLFTSTQDDVFRFSKNSYLAYFVAWRIRSRKNIADINFLLTNIESGIHGDILLFIVYELFDFEILNLIKDEIKKMWLDCPRLDFYKTNNPILSRFNNNLEVIIEPKSSIDKRIDRSEGKKLVDLKTKESNAFKPENGLTEDEIKIRRTLKLVEILGKVASSFRMQIENDYRTEIISVIKDTSFKVLYKIFDISSHKMDEIEADFKAMISKQPKLQVVSFSDVINYLYDTITTNSLNFLTTICTYFISKNSISCLSKTIDKTNENDLLFQTIALERYGKDEKYINFITTNYTNNCESIKYMMRRVTGLFLVYHPSIEGANLDKICSIQKLDKQKVLNVITSKKVISKNLLIEEKSKHNSKQ